MNLGDILITSISLCYSTMVFPANRLISNIIWLATAWISFTSIFNSPFLSLCENGLVFLIRAFLLFLSIGMFPVTFYSAVDSLASCLMMVLSSSTRSSSPCFMFTIDCFSSSMTGLPRRLPIFWSPPFREDSSSRLNRETSG
jgi:hypothetical protein